jgi:hypothetical protein
MAGSGHHLFLGGSPSLSSKPRQHAMINPIRKVSLTTTQLA